MVLAIAQSKGCTSSFLTSIEFKRLRRLSIDNGANTSCVLRAILTEVDLPKRGYLSILDALHVPGFSSLSKNPTIANWLCCAGLGP